MMIRPVVISTSAETVTQKIIIRAWTTRKLLSGVYKGM